jgi:hypothetical protein
VVESVSRSFAAAIVIAIAGVALISAAIDPVTTFRTISEYTAVVLGFILLFAAGYLVGRIGRRGPHAVTALLQSAALVGLAALIWLRPGVSIAFGPRWVRILLVALFVFGAIVARFSARLAGTETRLRAWAHARVWLIAVVLVALVALPPLALRLAERWDVSGFMDSHTYDVFAINIVNGKQPQGNSAYMPAYQYGLGLVYYVWGHFFFVQQIVNLVFACFGILALSAAGWILYRSTASVLFIGLVAAFCPVFVYGLAITQIEAWYLPATCLILLAWAVYWRHPSVGSLLALALTISAGMNLRNQGSIFFAWMCLSPLMVAGLEWRRRLWHLVGIGAIVAASLIPWTVRNYIVDGRLSPSGSRSALYLGVLNDRRVGLYGIRFWEGWDEVEREFATRYPNQAEREAALVRAAWSNVTRDPAWLARATLWRIVAFYGLLPNGYTVIAAIVPTNWRTEWYSYLYWRTTPLLLLPLSAVALLLRPNRTTLFLWGAIGANLSINLVSATSEDRLCYPVLLIHMLLVGALFADAVPARVSRAATVPLVWWRAAWPRAVVASVVFLVLCRVLIGSQYTYRPLMERGVSIRPSLTLDAERPALDVDRYNSEVISAAQSSTATRSFGQPVRLRGMLTNYMYPPKFAGAVGWVPAFATEPAGPTFYYLTPLQSDLRSPASSTVGVSFLGAEVSAELREGDAVDLEGTLLHVDRASGLWVRAERVVKLPIDRRELPAFR